MVRIKESLPEWLILVLCIRNAVMCLSWQQLIYKWASGVCFYQYYYNETHAFARFANTDLALALALRQRNAPSNNDLVHIQNEMIDHVSSYDCACQYAVNIEERFEKHFPDVAHLVKRMRWGIPALHIQGHRDDCMYLFSTSYMECVGHFHGETAEHYWPEANQLGPQTRQMNRGHRQDTLTDHHNDWNWKKLVTLRE
jgi:Kyakuja-Dileera-Zisupton transposase